MYFAKQCAPIKNDSSIPTETNCLCDAAISTVDFEKQDILKIIPALDINKAYGYDNISTPLIKICDSSIVKPLSILFHNSLNSGTFPDNWKRSKHCTSPQKRKQVINIKLSPCVIIAN